MKTSELILKVSDTLKAGSKIESIKLKWLWGEIVFKPKDLIGLNDLEDHISEIICRSFIEKEVMYINFNQDEIVNEVIDSLKETSTFLGQKKAYLQGNLQPSSRGLILFLERLRNICNLSAKGIYKINEKIELGNSGELESDYKVRPKDWLPEEIKKMRRSSYPIFRSLIEFLHEDNPIRKQSHQIWLKGREILNESEKDEVIPSWEISENYS